MTESMLDVNFDDAGTFETLPDNSEHELTIKYAQIVENKSDSSRNNLLLTLEKLGDETIDDINYVYLPVPSEAQKENDPKAYKKSVNRFKDFCLCMGVTPPFNLVENGDRTDVPEIVGRSGWCLVTESENPNSGNMQNGVRKFITSK